MGERTLIERLRDLHDNSFGLQTHELRAFAEAASALEALERERDEMRKVIAWANNSLYGSHGFFLSDHGGPPNEHHLDVKIEEMKAYSKKQWRRAETAEAERDALKTTNAKLYRSLVDRAAYDALRARVDGLEAALKPFAEWSRKLDAEFGDHEDDVIAGGIGGGLSITFGDLRAARRILSAKSELPAASPAGEGVTDDAKARLGNCQGRRHLQQPKRTSQAAERGRGFGQAEASPRLGSGAGVGFPRQHGDQPICHHPRQI